MIEWEPIALEALNARIAQGRVRMPDPHRRMWDAICIVPEKWQQHPYGDTGGGFWAVALMGRTVLWYNDIDDGFNRSIYSVYGTIDDYWRNDDELDVTMQYLANALAAGRDLLRLDSWLKKRA